MVRYFFSWTPLVIVATVVLLSLPWLGLIALMLVALVALPALGLAIVFLPYMLIRAISRNWQGRGSTSPRTAAALSLARRQNAWQQCDNTAIVVVDHRTALTPVSTDAIERSWQGGKSRSPWPSRSRSFSATA
jgi:hypothetical protein